MGTGDPRNAATTAMEVNQHGQGNNSAPEPVSLVEQDKLCEGCGKHQSAMAYGKDIFIRCIDCDEELCESCSGIRHKFALSAHKQMPSTRKTALTRDRIGTCENGCARSVDVACDHCKHPCEFVDPKTKKQCRTFGCCDEIHNEVNPLRSVRTCLPCYVLLHNTTGMRVRDGLSRRGLSIRRCCAVSSWRRGAGRFHGFTSVSPLLPPLLTHSSRTPCAPLQRTPPHNDNERNNNHCYDSYRRL